MPPVSTDDVTRVRAFNRFYTVIIGVLQDQLLQSPFTLAEVRVLVELESISSTARLREKLGLDAGQLSRIITKLERSGVLTRARANNDGRHQELTLTAAGRATLADLHQRSSNEVRRLLSPLGSRDRRKLLAAMDTIEDLLHHSTVPSADLALLPVTAGDLGWVLHRHGVLYFAERGWNTTYEGMVADILAKFASAARNDEQGWLAWLDGQPVGSIFCMRAGDDAALRLFLVEPEARGRGVGTALMQRCLSFATEAGYPNIRLWTVEGLDDARRLYEKHGFALTASESHPGFGAPVIAQTWTRRLTSAGSDE